MADTTFDIALGVQGTDKVLAAAAANDTLAAKLAAATSAADQAASAVSAGERAYASAQRSADAAAKAVERISVAADAQKGKLKSALDAGDETKFWKAAAAISALEAKQASASDKATAAKTSLAAEAAALDKLKASATAAADAQSKIAKTHDAAKKATDAAADAEKAAAGTGSARAIASGLGKLGGPLGETGKKIFAVKGAIDKLGKALGDGGPYVVAAVAAVAVVAALAAIAAAAIVATAKVLAWAVQLADAGRTSQLLSAGIAGTVKGGELLDQQLETLGKRVPLTRDELVAMASDLAKTGLKGAALSSALETAAVKAAKLKWGPDFAKQMLSLDSQSARLKGNIANIFGGLKIEKLLGGFSHLVELFDGTNASGRAMKVVFESLFQPLIDGIVTWIPKARSAFIQFEILVLKALIAIKPFGSSILLVGEIIGVCAAIVTGVLLVALGAVILSVTILGGAIALTISVIVALIAGIIWLGVTMFDLVSSGVASVISGFQGIQDFLSSISLVEVGVAMIDGLVSGISGAGSRVTQAMGGIVKGAVSSAKSLLGIASPSKVFAEIGGYTAEGFAAGVEGGTGGAQSALETLTAPPAAGGGTAAAPAGGAQSVNIENVYVNGEPAPAAVANDIRDALVQVLEGWSVKVGGATA